VAKLKFGAVISDARGSIEGVTFSKGRAGAFARKRGVPRLQQSARTSGVRVGISNLARSWVSVLTQAQRDAWIALAVINPVTDVFGNSHILTGQQLYIRVNRLRAQAGLTALSAAPADQSVTGLATLTVTATAPATLSLAFTATPLAAGHRLYIFATPPLSPGKLATKSDMAFLGVSATAQASPFAAGSLYAARFGDMISTRLISVSVAVLRDDRGALSPYFFGSDPA